MTRSAAAERLADELHLAPRALAAAYARRHPDQVRRRCRPIACDRDSRALLYDVDEVIETFREIPRRAAV